MKKLKMTDAELTDVIGGNITGREKVGDAWKIAVTGINAHIKHVMELEHFQPEPKVALGSEKIRTHSDYY